MLVQDCIISETSVTQTTYFWNKSKWPLGANQFPLYLEISGFFTFRLLNFCLFVTCCFIKKKCLQKKEMWYDCMRPKHVHYKHLYTLFLNLPYNLCLWILMPLICSNIESFFTDKIYMKITGRWLWFFNPNLSSIFLVIQNKIRMKASLLVNL